MKEGAFLHLKLYRAELKPVDPKNWTKTPSTLDAQTAVRRKQAVLLEDVPDQPDRKEYPRFVAYDLQVHPYDPLA